MNIQSLIRRVRSYLLQQFFRLLYGPLVLLHEPTGRILAGDAWSIRRLRLLSITHPAKFTLDLGCGSGILLQEMSRLNLIAVGVEPSKAMRDIANRRGCTVAAASSYAIPAASRTFDRVVISYPGPWIVDEETWQELDRVTRHGAEIAILLGGTYIRGPRSGLRRFLASVAYGNKHQDILSEGIKLGSDKIPGRLHKLEDRWGTSLYWIGTRC